MDLINIQPTGKTPIKESIPVFVITREGKKYNSDGIEFIKNSLKQHFGIDEDLAIFTGIGLNNASVLSSFLRNKPNAYLVLSTKDNIVF
ncbi:MAG: hypothetical protein K6F99_04290, partial [Lachnospiraceae bacterium]|nr:hypothetical protein [Lachnospiraceae bacterium]